MNSEIIYIRPAWGTLKTVIAMFGIGKEQIYKWRTEGYVLSRTQNNSIQYRIEDIDCIMTLEACGHSPRRINREAILKKVKQNE